MTKINIEEAQFRKYANLLKSAGLVVEAAEMESMLPASLPTEVGTVIMWYEDNDAGKNIGTFAERVHVHGEDQWRVNGFDEYPDTSLAVLLTGKTWWKMVAKRHEQQ